MKAARTHGFTITELLVVIAIFAVLLGLLIPAISRVRSSMRNTQCLNNLRNIGGAFRLYASENNGYLPEPSLANKSWEQMLIPHYGGSFECPADFELAPSVGSSYDWRDTGDAATSFAGRPILSIKKNNDVMAFDALPGWHGTRSVNVARLDGSATRMSDDECFRQVAGTLPAPAR